MNTAIEIIDRWPAELPVMISLQRSSLALRVLVVEDEVIIGMLFAETLVGMGHTVCALAVNEQEAVFAAREHEPDLMIVDARLGEGSGIAAVNDIIARTYIPHVFVTGDKPSVAALRPDAVIVEKPFRVAELAVAIRRAMVIAKAPRRIFFHLTSTIGE
jgi:two-component system, response regulator PdtaR